MNPLRIEMQIEIDRAVADGTLVSLVHERFETEETCENHRGGWHACLAELQRVLTAG